jgi:hypothetical protein
MALKNGMVQFDAKSSLICGIGLWFLATILESTNIFYMIPELSTIGLFLGTLIGGLYDSIPILK